MTLTTVRMVPGSRTPRVPFPDLSTESWVEVRHGLALQYALARGLKPAQARVFARAAVTDPRFRSGSIPATYLRYRERITL